MEEKFKLSEKAIEEVNDYFNTQVRSKADLYSLLVDGYEELDLLLSSSEDDISGGAIKDVLYNFRQLIDRCYM